MKTALGKGIEALIPRKAGGDIMEVELERVMPSADQPRKVFKEDSLKELAASIKEKGVLQPVIVAPIGDGSFRLIAGERRFRAARIAGLKKIPVIVRQSDPEDSLEVALIENIQREELGPVETAQAFQTLMKRFHMTQETLSEKVGKERATVANYLRLLKLPDEVKRLLQENLLSMGHARALLSLEAPAQQLEAARRIIKGGLSVREAESLVKKLSTGKRTETDRKGARGTDPQIASLEDKLRRSLGTKVKLHHKGKKGSIEIEYYSLEELDRLLDMLIQG